MQRYNFILKYQNIFNGKVICFLKTKNILVNPCISQNKLYIMVYMKADTNHL